MQWHPECMTPEQQMVLKKLGSLMTQQHFYLGGGTAIALYLGHRQSIDLDWFTEKTWSAPLPLLQKLHPLEPTHAQMAPGTLHAILSGVRCSWFEYPYSLLEPLTVFEDGDCHMASLKDLACMKLTAVAQRGSRKDFVDIYALGKKYAPLEDMLECYQQKYSGVDIISILYGLVYFDDAEREPMPKMLWGVSWHKIKKTIGDWVKSAGERT